MSAIEAIQRILKRRSHYRAAFQGRSGQIVLADLKRFCRAGTSPLVVSPMSRTTDAMATGVAIGRQEVFMRIAHHIHMSDAQLLELKEEAAHE